jgi:acetyl esterase/lipase/uncharacterized membrane protein
MFLSATGNIFGTFYIEGYFIVSFMYHILIKVFLFRYKENRIEDKVFSEKRLAFIIKKLILGIIVFVFIILYIAGYIMIHAQITGGGRITGQITGAGAGLAAGFILLLIIEVTFISLKYLSRRPHKRLFYFILITGIVFGITFSLPVIYRPIMIDEADRQFQDVFGSTWNDLPQTIKNNFLPTQFIESQFYFGFGWDRFGYDPEERYGIQKNICYANYGDYQLYYDVIYPAEGRAGPDSIGKNTTIIVLHSGGWNDGDKGVDAQQIQRYLAGQGYISFDIQYRLLNASYMNRQAEFGINFGFPPNPPVAPYRNLFGNYSIKDQISDIGDFTYYLAGLSDIERYNANLSSVVIMGVSAGGHLGAIVTYGYNDPWFAGNFSNSLTIKVAVLYNPPNDAEYFFYSGHPMYFPCLINGTPDQVPDLYYHYTPSNLVSIGSPPTILFQGTIDKMVPPSNTQTIYDTLISNGCEAIRIKGYFGGHGFDFGPNFAPITMYYLERFLYNVLK